MKNGADTFVMHSLFVCLFLLVSDVGYWLDLGPLSDLR